MELTPARTEALIVTPTPSAKISLFATSAPEWLGSVQPFTTLLAATIAGVVALYVARLANSVRRQSQIRLSESRLKAYAALWEITKTTSTAARVKLDIPARIDLYNGMADWYYSEGHALLLPARTYELWLIARANLIAPTSAMKPASVAKKAEMKSGETLERYCEETIQQQFSLLRMQMKADLAVYDADIAPDRLDEDSKNLLTLCGFKVTERPWKYAEKSYRARGKRHRIDKERARRASEI